MLADSCCLMHVMVVVIGFPCQSPIDGLSQTTSSPQRCSAAVNKTAKAVMSNDHTNPVVTIERLNAI